MEGVMKNDDMRRWGIAFSDILCGCGRIKFTTFHSSLCNMYISLQDPDEQHIETY